jgi:hypothetical protein
VAHKFDRTIKDPYVEAAHQVERNLTVTRGGIDASAEEDLYSTLSDAIVTAIGDIGATAYRHGVNQRAEVKGLAKAIAGAAESVLMAYIGEVDPDAAVDAIARDPRLPSMSAENRDELTREIEKTRQLEHLVLNARRLPALMDFAGALGLTVHEDAIEQGAILISADTQQPPPGL